ncbi:MAG: hypothetical protein JO282_02585 [Alphaproteobacteria bacterium]|nr:hypothetical protein [Alphaproteobacteria bacterium]
MSLGISSVASQRRRPRGSSKDLPLGFLCLAFGPLVPTIFQRRREALQREAALIICVAEHIRKTLLAGNFPVAKLNVIRYGLDPETGGGSQRPAERPYLLLEETLLADADSQDV